MGTETPTQVGPRADSGKLIKLTEAAGRKMRQLWSATVLRVKVVG